MDSPVVSVAEMRASEDAAFARGTTAEALMDEAAAGIAATIAKFFPQPGHCIVFAGKGNNAGDAFAAAEILRSLGWSVELRLAFPEERLGRLTGKKFAPLRRQTRSGLTTGPLIILDGLLGLGAKPPLRDPIRDACREINRLRREANAFVVAVDLPTGIDGDSGETDVDCVVADFTVTIGFAKRGLVADQPLNFVGRIEVVPLTAFAAPNELFVATVSSRNALAQLLPRREFGAYKNQFGRVGVVAGSKGFVGAALMCSLGALRGGAGLVELFVPEDIYPIVASAGAPETMVKPISSYRALLDEPIDVWAIGPGLGRANADEILELIERAAKPMVVDADALNIASTKTEVLKRAAGPRLVTPHPGEMKRLFELQDISRADYARRFCDEFPVTLLFKGSRTIVAEQQHPISYNTTGNPGMATGGMGDVLTGVCAALIAQKLSLYDAARVGAWICGRAAELAIFNGNASEESLLPRDVLDNLGRAFRELRRS
ncbi:MAG TPA: NAD(P)H-hydrate dehydratase [Chthoniobacterales bacterium]